MEIIQLIFIIAAIIALLMFILMWISAKATQRESQGCHQRITK